MTPRPVDPDKYAAGVLSGDRAWIGRAVTLVESTHPDHRPAARRLVSDLQPYAGGARRVGVSGVPGAGKSTLIDALGSDLTAAGHRVAVLAVDPSSARTGGSVLGDRTRMSRLSADPAAFVRPSPTTGTLGGVARATQEAIVVVEAAGYDVVLVETVGVGQSEVAVAGLVDTVLLVLLAGAGDQLQGMKKGVLEAADVIAVNKADGSGAAAAQRTARELSTALRLIAPAGRPPAPVLTCSAQEHTGLDTLWDQIVRHRRDLGDGTGAARRNRQQVDWMWTLARARIVEEFQADPRVHGLAARLAATVGAGLLTPGSAAEEMLAAFRGESS